MQPILLAHWCKLIEGFQFSPLEFYAMVEQAIKKREPPALQNSRVEWKEGGLLSMNRVYLRLSRHRLHFDICGAPFGKGFFVSSRLTRMVFGITAFHVTVFLLFALFVLSFFTLFGLGIAVAIFGMGGFTMMFGFLWFCVLVAFGLVIGLRNLNSLGLARFEERLLETPLFGPLYEALFQPMTYYRVDQMLMYQEAVHSAVMEAVDEMLAGKTQKPLTELERKPVFEGLLKR